jgi:hypothetical protein
MLTDNEIIKALKEILSLLCCNGDLQTASTVSDALSLINRQKAEIESLNNEIDKLLKQIPTTDAVEVVRCKDCPLYVEMTNVPQYNGRKARYCAFYNQLEYENGYCSHGMRKDVTND